MSASRAELPEADHNIPTGKQKVSITLQGSGPSQASMNLVKVSTPVPTNVFTGTLQGTLGFNTSHIKVLVEDEYDTQYAVLYWKFTDIKEWCHLKSKTPMSYGGISLEIVR